MFIDNEPIIIVIRYILAMMPDALMNANTYVWLFNNYFNLTNACLEYFFKK